ncbi:PREDICTED: uncharacterized protein LOC108554726, partial [Eufriesea mexicana]|uniref:uncharacterized protein LOC108554726 n=1 Tax=Eufriesea mexicana TaxID=516756 RepID=UPI00083C4339
MGLQSPPDGFAPTTSASSKDHEWHQWEKMTKESKQIIKMKSDDEASDTGAPDPGAPVADLSAVDDRVTVDEPGDSNGHDFGQCVDMPLGGQIQCGLCWQNSRNIQFLQEAKFQDHVDRQHPKMSITWRCAACLKSFTKLHACRCHLPKCKKTTEDRDAEPDKAHKCGSCGMSFETKRGLSTHERHRHPEIRNVKRTTASTSQSKGKPGRKAMIWTDEEVALLADLNERYRHLPQPNVKIREFLPGKTLKQISDKRRALPAQGMTSLAEEGEVLERMDSSSSSNLSNKSAEDQIEDPLSEEGIDWIESLRRYILAQSVDEENEFCELDKEIQDWASNPGERAPDIERWIGTFTEKIIQGTEGKHSGNNKKAINKSKSKCISNKKPNAHTRWKCFSYARYQEMYKKCPRRLVDMAIAGKLVEARERTKLPDKAEIECLYGGIWGRVASTSGLPKLGGGPSINFPMSEILTPVTTEELVSKMRKIKANTAAGVDGVRKPHLRKEGALFLLSKLFNCLMISRAYPERWKINRTTLIPKPGKETRDVKNWRPITIGSLL